MGASKIRSGRCGQGSLHSQMQMQPTRNQKYISTERAGNYSPIRAAEFSVCAASGQPDSVLFWFFFLGGDEERAKVVPKPKSCSSRLGCD